MRLLIRVPTKIQRLLHRIADTMPPTVRGMAVAVAASYALWHWGYRTMDLVVFVLSLAGLVLLALASVIIAGAAAFLTRRVTPGAPTQISADTGSVLNTGFQTPALSSLPLLKISWLWHDPFTVDVRHRWRDGRLHEEAVAYQRFLATSIRREIVLRDAFGLTRIAWQRKDPRPLRVLPHVGRLRNMPRVVSMASAEGIPHPSGEPEGDRMEIRRYVPGDSARHILWKAFARTRQLNVRVPERAMDRSRQTVAYLLAGNDDEAAAAAARVALEQGLLGDSWWFGADGTAEPTDERQIALDAIARSGTYRPSTAANPVAGLANFLAHPAVRAELHCVVFAAARPGPWVDRALELVRSGSRTVSFVLGTDGVSGQERRPLWHRALFRPEADAPETTHTELREMLVAFERAQCPALVVDRSSGRSLWRSGPAGSQGAPRGAMRKVG